MKIDAFNLVRDIPYRIPLDVKEVDNTCYGKHVLLGKMFGHLGIEVRPRICKFSWKDLRLPSELLEITHEEAVHAYLEAKINDKWVTLDATWDSGLRNILTVNDWDGFSATEICVKATKIYSPSKSLEIFHNVDDLEEDLRVNGAFYKAFNNWLEQSRL